MPVKKTQDKLNVLLIVMDCARADHLSCYGYARDTTPRIDQLAAEGMLFENAFATASWTPPSHASLFTGVYPPVHGVLTKEGRLDPQFHTLAGMLQSRGYRTAGFSSNGMLNWVADMSRGFDTFPELFRRSSDGLVPGRVLRLLAQVRKARPHLPASKMSRLVQRWLHRDRDTQSPFFVFTNYMEAHAPYAPPPPFSKRFFDERWRTADEREIKRYRDYRLKADHEVAMTSKELEAYRALYDGELNYMDHEIGRLVDYLRDRKLLDQTLLVITADHGEDLGEHYELHHPAHRVYDTQLHVPLIMRLPGRFPPGRRVAQLAELVDVFPTVMDALGVDWYAAQQQIQGCSLVPEKLPLIERSSALAYSRRHDQQVSFEVAALRTETWKYIHYSFEEHALFNIAADPLEQVNLADEYPQQAAELSETLEARLSSFDRAKSAADETENQANEDQELLEHLRGLGYIA